MIKTFDSKKTGSNLVIMAGVHGDEVCGLQAFNKVIPTFKPKSGKVTFIIGNPKAVEVCRREFETNLNRMFRTDEDLSPTKKKTYEYQRSRKLMPILAEADALLDIHSSTTKQTIPFAICEKQSFDCASFLPVNVVVSGIDVLHPTGTDAFVNQSGGLGICIECGYHNDPNTTDIAIKAISSFLKFFEVLDKTDLEKKKEQRFVQADWIYKNKGEFILSRSFSEFEGIRKGEVIGIDVDEKIEAPCDGVILFPNSRTKPNTEAFLFGKEL